MLELNPDSVQQLMTWFFSPNAPSPLDTSESKVEVALQVFGRLFLQAPALELDDGAEEAFEGIIEEQFHQSPAREVAYDCPYPKGDFLRYLVHRKGYLLHGSRGSQIDRLEPREQTDWSGTPTTAVFATGDGIWPLFFALVDRSFWQGSIRNGCFVVDVSPGESERFYFFSVNADALAAGVWGDGTIYVLPRETFRPTSGGPVHFDEWASSEAVEVVAQVPVGPGDFLFLANVTGHREEEGPSTTWLRYRERQGAKTT